MGTEDARLATVVALTGACLGHSDWVGEGRSTSFWRAPKKRSSRWTAGSAGWKNSSRRWRCSLARTPTNRSRKSFSKSSRRSPSHSRCRPPRSFASPRSAIAAGPALNLGTETVLTRRGRRTILQQAREENSQRASLALAKEKRQRAIEVTPRVRARLDGGEARRGC